MILLDTDTYTHLLFEHPKVVAHAREAAEAGESVGITMITKWEVLRGRIEAALKADTRDRFLKMQRLFWRAEEALQQIEASPLDEGAMDHFERLSDVRRLRSMGRPDLLIASVVLSRDATLATRNLKHFGLVPRLKYVNWVD